MTVGAVVTVMFLCLLWYCDLWGRGREYRVYGNNGDDCRLVTFCDTRQICRILGQAKHDNIVVYSVNTAHMRQHIK